MENDLTVIAVCRSEERQAANMKVTKNIRSVGKSAVTCVEKTITTVTKVAGKAVLQHNVAGKGGLPAARGGTDESRD